MSEAPGIEVPGSEAPGSEVPASEAPGSTTPVSEAPGSEVPASGWLRHQAVRYQRVVMRQGVRRQVVSKRWQELISTKLSPEQVNFVQLNRDDDFLTDSSPAETTGSLCIDDTASTGFLYTKASGPHSKLERKGDFESNVVIL